MLINCVGEVACAASSSRELRAESKASGRVCALALLARCTIQHNPRSAVPRPAHRQLAHAAPRAIANVTYRPPSARRSDYNARPPLARPSRREPPPRRRANLPRLVPHDRRRRARHRPADRPPRLLRPPPGAIHLRRVRRVHRPDLPRLVHEHGRLGSRRGGVPSTTTCSVDHGGAMRELCSDVTITYQTHKH